MSFRIQENVDCRTHITHQFVRKGDRFYDRIINKSFTTLVEITCDRNDVICDLID